MNFSIETVDIGITYPLKICSDFLAESLVIQKLQGSKLTDKRLPKILGDLLRVKNREKCAIIPFLKCSKILDRQATNFTANAPKILDLKSSPEQYIFQKLTLGAPVRRIKSTKSTKFIK